MALDARRGRPGHTRVSTHAARAPRRGGFLIGASVAAALLAAPAPGTAQQTVVIGDGGGPAVQAGGPSVTVNDAVLDSLGAGAPAPALPYAAPSGPAAPAFGPPVVAPGMAGTAYRLPDTGQLVVSRPGNLLYPPMDSPTSRLAVPPVGAAAVAPAAPARAPAPPQVAAGQAKPASRLLVAPAPPIEPVAEKPAPPAAPKPKAEPEPELATPAPKPPEAVPAAPEPPASTPTGSVAATATAPAEPQVPPPPPALTEELQGKSMPAPEPEAQPMAAPKAAPPPPPTGVATAPAQATETQATDAQTAALPPAGTRPEDVRLLFDAGSAELSGTATAQLEELAAALTKDVSARVQLMAYAQSTDGSASRARRLSLSRALAVRAYLIDQGVRSTRMDVRALGDKAQEGPKDRVDILPARR